jgi:hypothetical protein
MRHLQGLGLDDDDNGQRQKQRRFGNFATWQPESWIPQRLIIWDGSQKHLAA